MSILRKASVETKKVQLDATDFIEVRADLAQRDFERLLSNMPYDFEQSGGLTPSQGVQAQHALFDAFVVGWSLVDGETPVPATLEAYGTLEPDAALAINEKLADHFNALPLNNKSAKKRAT